MVVGVCHYLCIDVVVPEAFMIMCNFIFIKMTLVGEYENTSHLLIILDTAGKHLSRLHLQ